MPDQLLNEPTEKELAGDIVSLLLTAGARQIAMDYDESGKMTGMCFVLAVADRSYLFRMVR